MSAIFGMEEMEGSSQELISSLTSAVNCPLSLITYIGQWDLRNNWVNIVRSTQPMPWRIQCLCNTQGKGGMRLRYNVYVVGRD
jgi:hypothetical protein